MLRRLVALLACATALLAGAAVATAAGPPAVQGAAVLVGNGATGEVLFQRGADLELPMASITKVMTVLLSLENAKPSQVVVGSADAAAVGESSIDLRRGERLTVRELQLAAMLPSANDAAYALGEHVGGRGGMRRFLRLMNERADELGLEHTRYVRPDGLDAPGHHSSARDIFTLARTAMRLPAFRQLARTRQATISGGRRLTSTNDLLFSYAGTIGVKTGHTSDAGWCEVVAARRNGVTIYVVILGSPGREQRNADLAKLLDWGFAQYGRVQLISGTRTYAEAAVPYREEKALRLVAREPILKVVRWGTRLREQVVAPAMVRLPIQAGDELGTVKVFEGDEVIAEQPLIATESIAAPGVGSRMGWYADRALDHAGDLLDSIFGGIL
ncbi:MAG: D-alanyl-D-alanine carboxypeptidase family protein [Thermoleophilia bacterium]